MFVCLRAGSLVGLLGVRCGVATATTFGIRSRRASGDCRSGPECTGTRGCRRSSGMRIVTPVRGLLLGRGGLIGSGGLLGSGRLRGGGGLLAARAESEGLSGFGLRMLRSIRIACAEVGLTVAGAVRRPRIARCLCRIIGRLRCAGRGSGVLRSGPVLGRRRIGGRLALGVMFLRRCIGAGPLTVVRLPELLLVRLSVLLCAGLAGGGELALQIGRASCRERV